MTTITATNPRTGEAAAALISRSAWFWIGGLAVLFIALHHVLIVRMLRIATNATGDNIFEVLISVPVSSWNPDWSHAMVVPLISGYYIYLKRDALRQTPARLCWPGLIVLFAGLIGYSFWIYPGRNDMFQGYSMILSLLGLTLFLLGPGMLKILWFPIVYLAFAVKVSDRIWEQIAWKLQLIASQSATLILNLLGVDADLDGSTIELYQGLQYLGKLNVAEACSGLRMLMAFLALGVALAFLIERRWWERLAMCLFAVPIAVAVNIGRVTILGLLYLIDPKWASGDFHTFVGMLMLIPAAGLFLLLGWVLDKLILDDPDAKPAPAAPHPTRETANTLPAPEAADWPKRILPAFGYGLLLTVLVGLLYASVLAAVRPDLVLSGQASAVAQTGLILAPLALAVLLACSAFWTRRVSLRSAKPQLVGLGVVSGVLVASLFGQSAVLAATEAVLIKEAVPLRTKLYLLPREVGLWEQVGTDEQLGDDIVEELGTRDYVSRTYRDTSQPTNTPGSLVRLHVAYYTGTPDTVPHVPDRCFVAGGLVPVNLTTHDLDVTSSDYQPVDGGWMTQTRVKPGEAFIPSNPITSTVFTFTRADNADSASNVLYFFAANGRYLHTPELVRLQGFDPRDRYAYFCKIEVGVPGVGDRAEAGRIAEKFLSRMLPEVMACLPDWREVQAGRYPADNTQQGEASVAAHTPATTEPTP